MFTQAHLALIETALELLQEEIGKVGGQSNLSKKSGQSVTQAQITALREQIRKQKVDEPQQGTIRISDWRVEADPGSLEPDDERPYCLEFQLGNQSYFTVTDSHNETKLEMVLEINQGVPALHLSPGAGDTVLHVHSVDSALVLTPDSIYNRFETAEMNRYSYNDSRSLKIGYDE